MRTMVCAVLAMVAVMGSAPAPIFAQPVRQGCTFDALRQDDMAGTYESSTMRLVVYPCGGVFLQWVNPYGVHTAAYRATDRLERGGVVAVGTIPDQMTNLYLDGRSMLVVKPAEPGFVQAASLGLMMGIGGVYRLMKTGPPPPTFGV
jgi:hypothetical protein